MNNYKIRYKAIFPDKTYHKIAEINARSEKQAKEIFHKIFRAYCVIVTIKIIDIEGDKIENK